MRSCRSAGRACRAPAKSNWIERSRRSGSPRVGLARSGARIALGATRADVLQLVIGELFLLVTAGLVVGLLTSTAATRFTRTLLFGIGATDGTTLAAAAVLMCAVVAIAC